MKYFKWTNLARNIMTTRTRTSQSSLVKTETHHEFASTPMMNYNKNSQLQEEMNKSGIKLLRENASSLSKIFPTEFHVADFGCSHGKNSMACIKAALDGYLEVKKPISVLVHLNDLPSNDFNEVIKCLNDPEISYQEHEIFKTNKNSSFSTELIKNSYNNKIIPNNSLHLGLCFNCLHWMEKPVELSRGIFPRSTMTTPEERTIIANDAKEELTIFLLARYQELKSKGRLVLNNYNEWNILKHFDLNWHKYIKSKGFQIHQLKNVTIPEVLRPTEEIDYVLEKMKDKYTIISNQDQNFTSHKFNHDSFKAIFFNVILKGVKETNLFYTSAEAENFVEEFILSFPEDQLNLTMRMQFIVLEKK